MAKNPLDKIFARIEKDKAKKKMRANRANMVDYLAEKENQGPK